MSPAPDSFDTAAWMHRLALIVDEDRTARAAGTDGAPRMAEVLLAGMPADKARALMFVGILAGAASRAMAQLLALRHPDLTADPALIDRVFGRCAGELDPVQGAALDAVRAALATDPFGHVAAMRQALQARGMAGGCALVIELARLVSREQDEATAAGFPDVLAVARDTPEEVVMLADRR